MLLSAAKLSTWVERVKSVAAAVPAAVRMHALDTSAVQLKKEGAAAPL